MPSRPLVSWTLWAPKGGQGQSPPPNPSLAALSRRATMDTRDFAPTVAETMHAAFEQVCRSLGLVGEPDHFPTAIVAAKITHFANEGIHDADELSRAVLKDFKLFD
jgi:hypothetical protein